MCEWGTFITTSRIKCELLECSWQNSDCPSFGCNGYFHVNEQTHTGCLPTSTTLEHISTFLKRSKISLSSVIHSLKESLFVGRKGRKKSGTDDCLVGNSCQDRKTSVSEGKRRRKPHNRGLFCGLWPGHSILWTGFNYTKISVES